MIRRAPLALGMLLALPLAAQEPHPASLEGLISGNSVEMTLEWRFAPGDDPARADPDFDDSGWTPMRPLDAPGHDVGWYRRHLRLGAGLLDVPIVLRVEAPGATEVFLDGRRVLASASASGGGGAWTTVSFQAASTVIAVRHSCSGCERGFLLRIETSQARTHRLAAGILATVLATVPLVLAFIHLGLYISDRRSRENLFLTLTLASFSALVASSALADFRSEYPAMLLAGRLLTPAIISSAFFSLMTYYVIRRRPFPRTWIAFALVGALVAIATFFTPESTLRNAAWSLYFILLIVEVIRLEVKSPTRPETGTRSLLIGMIILQIAIVLQVLVVAGIIPGGFPWGNVYYFGLIAFAIGTSLFTVNTFALTRRRLERNEGEIESARKLQEAMLPKELPAVEGIGVAAWLSTATEVGGDYYDFREPPEGGLLVVIGDAAGHGLAAGAMVTAIKALFAGVRGDEDLAEFLARTDAVLRRMDLRLLHMCLSLVRITGSTIEISSAAMPPALIRRASTGAVEELGAGGLPLGGRLRGSWESRTAELAPGDTVLLASDGLAELLDPTGEPFGFDRVASVFGRVGDGSAQEILSRITEEATRWQGKAPQNDDITLVVMTIATP
jgi:hypothetical protein